MARPFALMNEPPVTAPAEPLGEQPGGAPVVRSLRDLLRPLWAQRVSTWMRRSRRCIRLSLQGRWQMARRMRPPDLWVSAEASMLPEVAPWDWDLRPMARGEPAVPTLPSSFTKRTLSHGNKKRHHRLRAVVAGDFPTPDLDQPGNANYQEAKSLSAKLAGNAA